MEYCGDFGSLMSQHSWTGQQGDISCPAAVSLARETVSELGAHQVFDERLAHGYNHQMFGRTAQVFDTMSNHAYPPQDHPSYHQLTHTSTYPPPYYHFSPYLPPYYPPYQELFMNSSAVTFAQGAGVSTVPTWHQQCLVQQTGTAEHASLLFDSKPTEMIQSCAIQGVTAALNFQVQASASAMDCQKVPSVYATYNEDDCFTKCEQKPHHGTETQSICDMLAHIQAKLTTVSENLSQDLKRMKSWESKQPASSQPNTSTQEAINMSDEMPVYDVYEDVTACRSRIHPTVDINEAEQIEVKKDSGNPRISPERPTVGTVGVFSLRSEQSICDLEKLNDGENLLFEKQDIEQFLSCSRKASKCRICDGEAQGDEKKLWDKTVCRTAIGHSVLFFLWDPGASASLHSSTGEPRRELSYVAIVFPKVPTLSNQVGTFVQKLRDSRWNVLVSHERRKECDPGDTELHVLFMVAAGVTKLQCTDVYKSLMLQILAVQFGARPPIFESAIMCSYAFGLGWTEVNASALFVLALSSAHTHFNFLSCNSPLSLGNFAISDLWCNTTLAGDKIFGGLNTAANSQNVLPCISISDTEHICLFVKLSPWTILSAQHFLDSTMKNSRIFSTERTLPCNPRYAILLLHHFLWEFSIRPATRLKWDPGVKVSLDCWLDVLTAWSENDNPLSCTRIPGLAALQTQSVGITTSYVWNPGSMLLQYKSLTEEKENVTLILEQWSFLFRALHCCQIFQRCTAMSSLLYWHQHIKFNGIALWLISLKLLNNGESF